MTVCDILKLGSIELITKTKQVLFPLNQEIIQNINDMRDTLLSIPNSAGLAANQIGIDKQIIMYRIPEERVNCDEEYFDEPIILINPTIDIYSNEQEDGWEGCLSIPSLRAIVPRYKEIHVSGFDYNGVLYEKDVKGFYSRNLQHEIDHLNGITIFERILNKKMISFKSELNNGILDLNKFTIQNSMGDIP